MKKVTDENLTEILNNPIVIIDFFADWCVPCRMMSPIMDELSTTNPDIIIGKLDVTTNKDAAFKFGVSSIPTIIYFKDGEEVDRVRGANSKASLQNKINLLKNS